MHIKINIAPLNNTSVLKLYSYSNVSSTYIGQKTDKTPRRKCETYLIKDFNTTFSIIYSR